jgi:hypothetical protein
MAGRREASVERVGHLPILYQRGAIHEPFFDPLGEPGSPVHRLLQAMNGYLDGLGRSLGLTPAGTMPPGPPDVYFGCDADPFGECVVEEVGRPMMRIAMGRPSKAWSRWIVRTMEDHDVDAVLVLALEVGQVMPRQRNILGAKVVDLGTGHTVALPWLTSLETPVAILQVTGALLDRAGSAIRIGAEGLLARRTGLLASAAGLQALITEEEVQQVLEQRRDDLPGRPLVWQVALRTLVEALVH